ncbi:MAG: hypothetical protein Fur0022_48330 [Anaerolineales bacterium]
MGTPLPHPTDAPFTISGNLLVAVDDAGLTSGAWHMPGVSYTQLDRVYLTGYYFCESPTCGDLGPDTPEGVGGVNLFVTLGSATGPSSLGYTMDVEPVTQGGNCTFTNQAGLINFFCLVTPNSGWGQVHDYVWLTVDNSDSQVENVYLQAFAVDWGWTPAATATPAPTFTPTPTEELCDPACLQGTTPPPVP